MNSEDREAIALVEAFARQWPKHAGKLLHIANEGGNRGQHPGYHVKRARMGVVKGTADYFLAVPVGGWHGLWLELKAPTGTLKAEQRAFLEARLEDGYAACVAWGWTGALRAIELYSRKDGVFDEAVVGINGHEDGPLAWFTLGGKKRAALLAPTRSGGK